MSFAVSIINKGLSKVQVKNKKKHPSEVVLESRNAIPEITEYLNEALHQLQSMKYQINGEFNAEEIFEILNDNLPNSSNKSHKVSFIKDIVRLCGLFFPLTESKKMRLHIEVVTTDMCRFFHVDNYRQRLLCTYKGPGTEWLDNANVNPEGLGKGCNGNIVKDFDKIHKAKEFEVLLLKGSKYEETKLGVVHRSPPIKKEGKTRILLKIDER